MEEDTNISLRDPQVAYLSHFHKQPSSSSKEHNFLCNPKTLSPSGIALSEEPQIPMEKSINSIRAYFLTKWIYEPQLISNTYIQIKHHRGW